MVDAWPPLPGPEVGRPAPPTLGARPGAEADPDGAPGADDGAEAGAEVVAGEADDPPGRGADLPGALPAVLPGAEVVVNGAVGALAAPFPLDDGATAGALDAAASVPGPVPGRAPTLGVVAGRNTCSD